MKCPKCGCSKWFFFEYEIAPGILEVECVDCEHILGTVKKEGFPKCQEPHFEFLTDALTEQSAPVNCADCGEDLGIATFELKKGDATLWVVHK